MTNTHRVSNNFARKQYQQQFARAAQKQQLSDKSHAHTCKWFPEYMYMHETSLQHTSNVG